MVLKTMWNSILSLALLSLFVQPSYAADKWLRTQSKNFQVVGNAGESDVRRVARYFEEFRSALAMIFPKLTQTSSVPTTVVVFKDEASLRPYKTGTDNAFFQPNHDVNYIAMTASPNSASAALHQYVHLLADENSVGLPLWALEGLAECYSTFEVSPKAEFTFGRSIDKHVAALGQGPLLPLKTLLTAERHSAYENEQSRQGIFYAESWALVHYLILGGNQNRRPQFVKFIQLRSEGASLEDSFTEAFQTDYFTLQDELLDYLRKRDSLPYMRIVASETAQADKAMTVAQLAEADSEFYRGDLLLHTGRLADAEVHLKNAAAKNPKLVEPVMSLGTLRLREKKYDEALALLKKAVEADPSNAIGHYSYAAALNEGGASQIETIRTHAGKAVELAPRFVEGYVLLARADLAAGEHLDESETSLRRALAIAPGRNDLRLLLAQIYLRSNRTADAAALLSTLENSADPEVRRPAMELLSHIDSSRLAFTEIAPEPAPKEPALGVVEAAPAPAAAATPPAPSRREPVLEPLTPIGPTVTGEKVEGLLILLDCTNGLTLRVRTDKGTMDLHSSQPENIQFLSYTVDVTSDIKCGPRTPGTPVSVTYRPAGRGLPEPLVVEFKERK
jgi:tetratricopeptide (TPR) repeat protein